MAAVRLPLETPIETGEGGTLFVVATPIGNLEDITLRALRMLREVAVVAAEDTRRTGNLLRHYQIATPLLSLHEHNERQRIPRILEQLRVGRSVALVSDAGTPGLSDPGALIVHAVRQAGFQVVPVPGPSSIAAIASVAGIEKSPLSFFGFPPIRAKHRKPWVERVAALSEHAVICFEAPHRLLGLLKELTPYLGNRPILIGREMTKLHEEWKLGTAAALQMAFAEPKGEFVLLIFPQISVAADSPAPSDDDVRRLFGQLTDNLRLTRREAVKATAKRLSLPARAVYAAVERGKK